MTSDTLRKILVAGAAAVAALSIGACKPKPTDATAASEAAASDAMAAASDASMAASAAMAASSMAADASAASTSK
jgi:hypothetical protein